MATSTTTPPPQAPVKAARRKLPLILAALVVLALAAGAAWFFLLKEPAAEPEPVEGTVVAVEPVSINLANGSYLRLAIALQLTEETTEDPDTSEAIDLAITTFSGREVDQLSDPAARDALQQELTDQVISTYPGEVMDVYYTEFVTQ
ncbi:flagellar basal body-associated protein FliL [uncultured Pseudokineococcus sp.]|uniref:flagellar basal body-associated FliL family protein n=1 Tax=uncultured Pseudokineococcus sp. TaxID=1642928 RepID=UPI00260E8BEA|nr:flagellar basal body-associated FliL family protein [uncultured Pseudokineococcus sp.]